jgi:hypothetical protein
MLIPDAQRRPPIVLPHRVSRTGRGAWSRLVDLADGHRLQERPAASRTRQFEHVLDYSSQARRGTL